MIGCYSGSKNTCQLNQYNKYKHYENMYLINKAMFLNEDSNLYFWRFYDN